MSLANDDVTSWVDVVLDLVDDNDIQIKYYLREYLGKKLINEEGKLLDIYYLNDQFYKGKNIILDSPGVLSRDLLRFKTLVTDTFYINRSIYPYDKFINWGGDLFKEKTLPLSINKENVLLGILEMSVLSVQLGGFTEVYIRYNNEIKSLSKSRHGRYEDDALLLILEFLRNNNISVFGLNFDDISLKELHCLALYIDMINYRATLKPEPYGEILKDKIKRMVKSNHYNI